MSKLRTVVDNHNSSMANIKDVSFTSSTTTTTTTITTANNNGNNSGEFLINVDPGIRLTEKRWRFASRSSKEGPVAVRESDSSDKARLQTSESSLSESCSSSSSVSSTDVHQNEAGETGNKTDLAVFRVYNNSGASQNDMISVAENSANLLAQRSDEIITVDVFPRQQQQNEVESSHDDEVFEEEASKETNPLENDFASVQHLSSFRVPILTESTHHQLKPILKRKDSLDNKNLNLQTVSFPPPILKKRDSLIDNNIACPIQCSNVSSANATSQTKPASILKNRQPRGSHSFDDNLGFDTLSQAEESSYQLKPILKKKSFSTEEKTISLNGPNGTCPSNDGAAVKGILKTTSDRSNSSSAISSAKNSVLDLDISPGNALQSELRPHSPTSGSGLKGILKSSSLKSRSTSLSPCASSESLADQVVEVEVGGDRISSSPHRPRSAFRKRTSLDNDYSTSPTIQLFDFEFLKSLNETAANATKNSKRTDEDQLVIESGTEKNIRPILKRNSVTEDLPDSNFNAKMDDSSTETDVTESSRAMFPGVTLRADPVSKSRPKSCIIPGTLKTDGSNSISERLALLKQNEEGWKNRIAKVDVEKEIKKVDKPKAEDSNSNVIANRLSSLVESQSKWRNRVPEKDAKQFTVSSKLNPNSKSGDEKLVTLRETPKRHGLARSSLSEKKIQALGSKLNDVFSSDRSPFSKPTKPKLEEPPIIFDEPKEQQEKLPTKQNHEQVFILKPDDEETFGSFFGLDPSTMDQILGRECPSDLEPLSFDKLDEVPVKLLPGSKRATVQAPKRKAASSRNPIKVLATTSIAVDSYQSFNALANNNNDEIKGPTTATTNVKPATAGDSKYAITALAGLASLEDFKSVASNLRSSNTNGNHTYNDSWRKFDLKNSNQSKMLILVKGRRKAQTRLVEPDWHSLNQTDSFILVTKDSIYAYVGKFSNIIKRTKCIEIAELIRKRKDCCFRSCTGQLTLIDCQNEIVQRSLRDTLLPLLKELNFTEENHKEFDEKFLQPIDIDLDAEDEFFEEAINYGNMVYRATCNEKQDPEVAELKLLESYCGRSPRHQVLQPDMAIVFDFGCEMYVWLGKNVSNVLRKKAVDAAKELWISGYNYSECEFNPFGENSPVKADERPEWAWFTRINQYMEPILFKDKFFNWPAFTLTRSEKRKPIKPNISGQKEQRRIVKKDLSAELNLFPVDVETDMINKIPKEPELILENVSIGRGAGDIIKDEDGLSVKVISLEWNCFYIDELGERVKLPDKDRNFLCNGESYYIRWKYRLTRTSRDLKTGGESRFSEQHGGRDRLCYFVWQGKNAKNTKRGITALNAIEKLREEGAFQIYIEHGHEEPAFLRIFEGSLVIQSGNRGQVSANKKYRMFMLNDTLPGEEFMVELECCFKNLRSRTSYAFLNPGNSKQIFIWHGIKTTEIKRNSLRKFVEEKILSPRSSEFGFGSDDSKINYNILEMEEGKEPKDFFDVFDSFNSSPDSTLKRSSKSNLQRDIYFSLMDDSRQYDFTPRLFHLVTSPERVFESHEFFPSFYSSKVIINYPFTQDMIYDVARSRPTFFLFDNQYEVYLWESKYPFFICNNNDEKNCGSDDQNKESFPKMIDIETEIQSECNTTTGSMSQLWLAERKCALETTLAYCHAKSPTEPPKSYIISAGLEPDAFRGLFPTWTYYDNVAKLHIEDGRKPGEQILVSEVLSQIQDINQSTYSYEELRKRPLPEGINILCLESYLDDGEFEKIFSMNREEFHSLPTWRQKLIKQEKGLF